MYPFFILQNLPEGRLFALDLQVVVTSVIVLINVAILAYVLSKLLYRPVLRILHERRVRILEDVQTAEKDKIEALKLKEQYEMIMKNANQEKYEILESARKLAVEKSREQVEEARAEAESIKARALKEIELEQERAKSEMKQAVIDVSSSMVLKFLSRTIEEDVHQLLFDETMAELEEIAWHS